MCLFRAGRMNLDARMSDNRSETLLRNLPEGEFMKIKFLQINGENDLVVQDKIDPVKLEQKKDQGVVKITRATAPGVLTGIDSVYYQNAYPVTAVVYGLYLLEEPDPANLAPMRVGNLNCVAQKVVEHF